MVNLRLLGNRDFAMTFVLMLMFGFMLLGSTYLLPAYTQSLMGYRAVDAGMVLTPGVSRLAYDADRGPAHEQSRCASARCDRLVDRRTSLLWMIELLSDVSFRF